LGGIGLVFTVYGFRVAFISYNGECMEGFGMKKKSIFIGIDPGQSNGYAIRHDGVLKLRTLKLYELFEELNSIAGLRAEILVHVENPNLWTYFKNSARADDRLQGAGSVKGTYSHIAEFLKDRDIDFVGLRPDKARNAYGEAKNRELFNKVTGYTGVCSTHARDAAMLIVNCK
jgi:hypothetical protein